MDFFFLSKKFIKKNCVKTTSNIIKLQRHQTNYSRMAHADSFNSVNLPKYGEASLHIGIIRWDAKKKKLSAEIWETLALHLKSYHANYVAIKMLLNE